MDRGLLERYLLVKPNIRALFEWAIFIVSGVCSYFFSVLRLPRSYALTGFGIALFLAGMVIHALSHKEHKQAHEKAGRIQKLVTTGIYSKIRHPGYLGVIMMYLGASLWFESLVPILIALLFSGLHVLTALKEEEYLLKKFGDEYRRYMERVRWRFIPGLF